jgi:hypothetical protein
VELSLNDRTQMHLERPVLDIADDPRFCLQFKEIVSRDGTVYQPVDHDVHDIDCAFDACLLAHHQRAGLAVGVSSRCLNDTVDAQASGETDVALDGRAGADQAVSMRFCGGACFFRSNMESP